MNKKILWIVLLIVFVLGLIFISVILNNKVEEPIVRQSQSETSKVKQVNMRNYEEEVLKSTKVTLIDFYADWCAPCRQLSPLIEEIASKRDDINFVKINVDAQEELANKYGIISIPTLVVIKDGKEVKRSIGYIQKNQIEELINIQ